MRSERLLAAAASLAQVTPHVPEAHQRAHEPKLFGPETGLPQCVLRQAEVVVFGLEPVQPGSLLSSGQMGLSFLRQAQEILGVPAPEGLSNFELLESLGGVLADRLQHPEALL